MVIEPLGTPIERDSRDPSPRPSLRPKLSVILLALVRPFLHETERSLKEMRSGIALASAVWNATVLEQQGESAWQRLTETLRGASAEDDAGILAIATAIRARKLDRHASDMRTVLSWTVTERSDAFDVQVLSARTEGA